MQVMKESFPDIILPPKETTGKDVYRRV